ncbi:MAG TPA: hypothetical protein VFU02_02735, partial [Polyangiaceae bacterium]|nr:hypothetical protein [Polyangiaceae bacterium]
MRFQGTHLGALLAALVQLSCSSDDESEAESQAATEATSGSNDGGGGTAQGPTNSVTSGNSGNPSGNDVTSTNSSGGSDSGPSSSSEGGDVGSTSTTNATASSGGAAATGGNTTGGNGTNSAKEAAEKLGRSHFLIGMGNDLAEDHNQDGAYTLGVTLDLHYAYLVGLPGQGGWPDWNAGGTFVNVLTDTARNNGVVPMFTMYMMAAAGENNLAALTDPGYMGPYWEGAKLLFERLAEFGDPAVVHLEPDFWAFAQQAAADPAQHQVLVGSVLPECSQLPDTMAGMGRCWVHLAREIAPQALIGFHASGWAGGTEDIVRYLRALGAGTADLVMTDMLDRDAGCFEAGNDPNCTRSGEGLYWDETNQTSPNFHDHLAWARAISEGLGKPMLWWQVPFGVPSETPGGTPGHYRDNRVKYIFEHV